MVKSNPHLARLEQGYLFAEIAKRKDDLLARHPKAEVISLGIGDTTEAIPRCIVEAFLEKAAALGTETGFSGYDSGFGTPELRQAIASNVYNGSVLPEEVFVSDGAKPDIGRLQWLFSDDNSIALQDPVYPAYKATSLIAGKKEVITLPCTPDNGFCPDWEKATHADIIVVCSPNNPTGAVLTYNQLESLVHMAKKRQSVVLFDAAYRGFVRDEALPLSIFAVDGARDVAIETCSFSKMVGFTGVRLGWTVVPKALRSSDGRSLYDDWCTIVSSSFNGASNLAQAGGLAALTAPGRTATRQLTDGYLGNARILREAVQDKGLRCYGGEHSPYLWVDTGQRSSWEMFDHLLEHGHLVTTPGVGFGPSGEGFIRLSAFGHRQDIEAAAQRLMTVL